MATVSAIIPTIGRAESLTRLLQSLALQTQRPEEVIVADGSETEAIATLLAQPCWQEAGLQVQRIAVQPPNAVRQRQAAIAVATGEFLLLLDDDVELEPACVEELLKAIAEQPGAVAAMADFNNQTWSQPTAAWRMYLRLVYGFRDQEWQGKVVGPLLRFGYHPSPSVPSPMQWLGAGNSLIRRSAYHQVGGFSNFFLHRCTMNEDVDLGLKLSRVGTIYLCPTARLGHFHDPNGRVSPMTAAEDDLYNRFMIFVETLGCPKSIGFYQVLVFTVVESGSQLLGAIKRRRFNQIPQLIKGRFKGLRRILT